jgi:hypothetical protein
MKRKRGKGLATPLLGLLPPSPIYMLDMLLFYTHLVVSIPYLVAPHHGCCLSEALPKLLATNTWRSGGGGVLADPYFCCPTGPRTWRMSPNRTCDRVWRRRRLWRLVHDLVIVKWTTTLTTSSERLHQLRQVNDYVDYVRLCKSSPSTFVRERKIPLPVIKG